MTISTKNLRFLLVKGLERQESSIHFMQKWYVIILKRYMFCGSGSCSQYSKKCFRFCPPFRIGSTISQKCSLRSNSSQESLQIRVPTTKKSLSCSPTKPHLSQKELQFFFYRTFFPPTDQLVFFVDRLHLHVIDLTHEFHHLRFFGPGTAPGPLHSSWKSVAFNDDPSSLYIFSAEWG